jgi:hypothetical protein
MFFHADDPFYSEICAFECKANKCLGQFRTRLGIASLLSECSGSFGLLPAVLIKMFHPILHASFSSERSNS